jgi:hypothetical protein
MGILRVWRSGAPPTCRALNLALPGLNSSWGHHALLHVGLCLFDYLQPREQAGGVKGGGLCRCLFGSPAEVEARAQLCTPPSLPHSSSSQACTSLSRVRSPSSMKVTATPEAPARAVLGGRCIGAGPKQSKGCQPGHSQQGTSAMPGSTTTECCNVLEQLHWYFYLNLSQESAPADTVQVGL